MKKEIVISLPYESREEFEARQKQIFKDAIEEASKTSVNSGQHNSYITRKNTAELLHISLPTLNELTKSGILKGYRLQGRVLYKIAEIDNALTEMETIKSKRTQ